MLEIIEQNESHLLAERRRTASEDTRDKSVSGRKERKKEPGGHQQGDGEAVSLNDTVLCTQLRRDYGGDLMGAVSPALND